MREEEQEKEQVDYLLILLKVIARGTAKARNNSPSC